MSRPPLRTLATIAGVAVLPLASVVSAHAAAPSRTAVPGNAPAWATSAHLNGHPAASQTLTVRVGLAPRDAAGAEAYAAAVSDPSSSSYRHFLTPAQYAAKFGPAASSVSAVKSFLTSAGLKVTGQTPAGDAVDATGTVAQVQSAFGTTLATYSHGGHTLRAPSSPATIPSSLAGIVESVGGLTDTSYAVRPMTKSANDATPATQTQAPAVATPCSHYYGEVHVSGLPAGDHGQTSFPTANCGYTPQQMRGAYGLSPSAAGSTDGAGVTVAIIDAYASPTMASDANTYSANHGLATFSAGQYTEYPPTAAYYDQTTCEASGWTVEESLDIEAVHSMAPAAKIAYVPTASCNDEDFLDAYSRVLTPTPNATAPLATIVSNSYGDSSDLLPGDLQSQEHSAFVQAATEGVGYYFSSGDDGDAAIDNNGVPQPQASANDPAVTAVGGTSLGVTQANGYGFETGWGDDRTYLVTNQKTKQSSWLSIPGDFYSGAGGGTSGVWAEPSYQKGVVPDSLASSLPGDKGPGRVVPDVAAIADPYTGFLQGYSTPDKKGNEVYAESSIGGTSLACPTFAGVMAVAQSRDGGSPIGFANPLLYDLYRSQPTAFHDIAGPANADQSELVYYSPSAKLTRLVTLNHDSSLATATGYDNVTGLGSPGATFVAAVATAAAH